ncbi:GntR family transcriptional regulator [Neorhizobium sp. DT-125]|uniref:GntR family transcriptional regulator n=1 Tax=Neorhizobium sp. DT-125 TaxID=3396163 RepID=UPI003F1BEB55
MAEITWNEDQPIYRQIVDALIRGILEGTYREGELLPSVRQLATDFGVSTITTTKVFQELSEEGVTEKRRGIGFEVRKGIRKALLQRERRRFLEQEWPELRARLNRLDIRIEDLLRQ